MEDEPVLPDRIGSDLKENLLMGHCKRDTEKDFTLDIQMKSADFLLIENDIKWQFG